MRPPDSRTDTFPPDDDRRLADAVAEYQRAVTAGRRPTRDALRTRYPDLADRLDACIQAVEMIAAAVPPTTPISTPVAAVAGRVGEFRLVREVGRGGMGVVYEAVQDHLGRRVAVKVLASAGSLTAKALGRFRHESQAAAALQHPHIVPVFAVGEDRGVHYFAMQFIDGGPLSAQSLGRRDALSASTADPTDDATGTFSPNAAATVSAADARTADAPLPNAPEPRSPRQYRTAAEWVRQAADALQHAHEYGIVHRDIKPGNLLLDRKGHLWVADFGLAKLPGSDLTGPDDVMGTLRYMSPEQASGRADRVDGRTDVYSLGVTLYELLTGVPAFPAEDREGLLRQVINHDPKPPRKVCPAVPRDLETVCRKAMAKESADRYQTAAAFRDDLQRFLDGRPILARRTTWAERSWRWCGRYPAAAALLATLFVAVAGFAGLSYRLGLVNRDLRESNAREAVARKHLFTALETAVSGGAEDHLVGQRDLTPRQREFYEALVLQFRALADAAPDDDDTQKQVANAMTALGGLKNRLGDPAEAATILRDAIRRQQALRDRRPTDTDLTADLARSHLTLGHSLEQKEEWVAADAAIRVAVELLDPILRENPDRLRDLRVLGSAKKCLAVTHSAVGNRRSVDWLEGGLADLERVLAKTPDDSWARYEAADCLHLIAGDRSRRGEYSAAKEACDRGLAYIDPLTRRPSAEIHYLLVEAKLLIDRATTAAALKDHAAARRDYDAAEGKLAVILGRSPGQHAVRRQLGLTQLKHGQAYDEGGDQRAGLKHFDEATATFRRLQDDQPRVPNHRHNLAWVCEERARVLIKLGQHKEARGNLEECLRVWEPLAEEYAGKNVWYPLGIADAVVSLLLLPADECPYRTEAERETAAAKAVANLNAAVAGGWGPSARTRTEYQTGAKWKEFRTRPDFQQYLTEVEKRAAR